MTELQAITLGVLAGLAFPFIGFSMRAGGSRGIYPMHVFFMLSLVGAAGYLPSAWADLPSVPLIVLLLGVLSGVTQYVVIRMMRIALAWGPLSMLWCAIMLAFLPTTLFAGLFLEESLGALQVIALCLAVLCVFLASKASAQSRQDETSHSHIRPTLRHVLYGLALLTVLVFNSVLVICLKVLGSTTAEAADGTLIPVYESSFYVILYLTITLVTGADLLLTRCRPGSWIWMIALGIPAAAGSMGGILMLGRAQAILPAATILPIHSVASILFTAIVATVAFRERRTAYWYATLACGVAVVLVGNAGPILAKLGIGG